jgi:hypothetical protein
MTLLRRHLRLWVAAWLAFQVASLSAFVPRDCCAAHRRATSSKHSCHQNDPATHCPMRAAAGAACAMHQGSHTGADASNQACSMRGTCDGPMAALLALLSNHGVLTDSFVTLPDPQVTDVAARTREHLITRLAPPDPPPPRA